MSTTRFLARSSAISVSLAILATASFAWAQQSSPSAPTPGSEATAAPPASAAPPQQTVVVQQQPTTTVQWGFWGPRVVTSGPPAVINDYHDGDPIPQGYRPAERVRKGAIIGGAIMFGVPWLLSATVAAASHDVESTTNADALYIPLAGPFIQMTQTSSSAANLFLALDGILQCGGVALAVYGIVTPRTVLVRQMGESTIRFAPLVARGAQGIAAVGTF
jgi:hypothetical protein